MTRPPARCNACQVNRVAWVKPRVDYCYDCLPGGPFTPPPCRQCGSEKYFSQGLCERCHPGGPLHLGSCRGCLAWGVYRAYSWLCWSCRWWRTHYPVGDCCYCGRNTPIGELGACRLCLDQARNLQEPGRALDLASANRYGQQLSFANMRFQRPRTPRLKPEPRSERQIEFTPLTWHQLLLVEVEPDPQVVKRQALDADNALLRYCKDIVGDHAARYGWSKRQRNGVTRSLRLLQVLQETPGAKIRASDVLQLPPYGGSTSSVLDVLAVAGLLIDDRPSAVERYFAGKTATLPTAMRTQLATWLEVMVNGSTTPPRQHPRDPRTVQHQVRGITPILQAWAVAGHESLAEITSEQVLAALPKSGPRRNIAEQGLRSLFGVLKARRLIFIDPAANIGVTPVHHTVPLPLDTQAIRDALDSPSPAVALAVALVAFHALTSREVRNLKLSDVVDGRLTLGDRVIPLAGPVRVRLAVWLDHRARRWPGSINPHLLLGRRSAPRLVPVGRQFPWISTKVRPQALREDRILQEIHATGGDIRRICDLFGLSIEGALRYARTISPLDGHREGSRTPDAT